MCFWSVFESLWESRKSSKMTPFIKQMRDFVNFSRACGKSSSQWILTQRVSNDLIFRLNSNLFQKWRLKNLHCIFIEHGRCLILWPSEDEVLYKFFEPFGKRTAKFFEYFWCIWINEFNTILRNCDPEGKISNLKPHLSIMFAYW